MADVNEPTGMVSVRAIYWHPDLERRPDLIVDRDGDIADSQAALRIWQRLAREYGPEEWTQFLNSHAAPADWREPADVQHFLESVAMELPLPIVITETAALADDARPGVDRDVTVAVLTPWSQDINEANVIAGFDQAGVERRLAEMILEHTGTGPVDGGPAYVPVLDDAVSVSRWLERAQQELPQLPFTVQQKVLPGVPAATPLAAVETPNLGATVWVGAVFLDGRDGDDDPEFLAANSREELQRAMATRLYQMMPDAADRAGAQQFLDDHTRPSQWLDDGDVAEWLDSLYASSPGPAFTYQQIPLTVTSGAQMLSVAAVVEDNPFDARLYADTDPALLRRTLADDLVNRLGQLVPALGGAEFLAEHGQPRDSRFALDAWLDDYADQVGTPAFAIDQVALPDGLNSQPATNTAGPTSTPDQVPTAQPAGMTVRVDDLWAAVIESEELGQEEPQVWVGDYDTVAQAAVRILADAINPDDFSGHIAEQRAEFLANHPVDMADVGSIEEWLDAYRGQFGEPAVWLRQVYDPAKTQNLPGLPDGIQPPAADPPLLRVALQSADSTAALAQNTVTVDSQRLPSRGEVVVGVVSWDDADDSSTLVGATVEQVEAAAARQLFNDLHTEAFDAQELLDVVGDPAGLDPAGVKAWLTQVTGVDGKPVVHIHEHVDAATLTVRLENAANNAVLGMLAPPVNSTGKVMIDTQRAADWESLNDGGIPDKLIAAIDPAPIARHYVDQDGRFDSDTFYMDQEDWMDQTLATAMDIANLPELHERLDQLEYLRDRLVRELGERPLPVEPQPADFAATRPSYEGEFDDMAYRWHHNSWQETFTEQALARDTSLRKLLATTAGEQPAAAAEAAAPARLAPSQPVQPVGMGRPRRAEHDVTVTVGFNIPSGQYRQGFPMTPPGQPGNGGLSL